MDLRDTISVRQQGKVTYTNDVNNAKPEKKSTVLNTFACDESNTLSRREDDVGSRSVIQ